MNERILELAEQAGLSEGVFTRHDGAPCNLKGYSMLPDQIEKFAELIVRECADFLKDKLDDHFAAEQLEEHFGVEQ